MNRRSGKPRTRFGLTTARLKRVQGDGGCAFRTNRPDAIALGAEGRAPAAGRAGGGGDCAFRTNAAAGVRAGFGSRGVVDGGREGAGVRAFRAGPDGDAPGRRGEARSGGRRARAGAGGEASAEVGSRDWVAGGRGRGGWLADAHEGGFRKAANLEHYRNLGRNATLERSG
ncbi:hypothetical protein GCM10009416_28280 [Craurococcus roseus]|uniref:Uncharacterized protein n=1 Tax=Craurococcus roseus TaxID=77585 RepID=A0ABN1FCX0_9PROT